MELWKGAGVWIDAALLSRLVKLAEFSANRKPPHQALVKSLLTQLMGMEKYMETSAERMDRRLLSAVVGMICIAIFYFIFKIEVCSTLHFLSVFSLYK